MDGSGYNGLRGEEIPVGARIIAVADAYDAMTTDRPYRRALDRSTACNALQEGVGTQFDDDVVVAFLEALNDPQEGLDSLENPPALLRERPRLVALAGGNAVAKAG